MRPLASLLTALSFLVVLGPMKASAQQLGADRLSQALYGYQHDPSSLSPMAASPADPPQNCTVVQGTLVLTQDTTGCFNLTTGATLDLNGFTVTGTVGGFGFGNGASGATVRNGTVTAGNINFEVCSDCVIEKVRVTNGTGFVVQPGGTNRITGCFFSGNSVAVDLFLGSGDTLITHSTFENNGIGINFSWTTSSTASSNIFIANSIGIRLIDELAARSNTLVSNDFTENEFGIVFSEFGGFPCLPVANNCLDGNLVSHNSFLLNRGSGLLLLAGTSCSASSFPLCFPIKSTIRKNFFLANGFGPIPVSSSNDDDGLTLVGPPITTSGFTVEKNGAVFNENLGINAPNVIDGGGNVAIGNGNPAQCVGVVCAP